MSKIKMVETLVAATGKPQEAHAFMKAWEEDERAREIKYEKLITQMHRDNEKFIASVQRELALQSKELSLLSKQLRFLSWAIPAATAFLALMIAGLGIVFVIFGAG